MDNDKALWWGLIMAAAPVVGALWYLRLDATAPPAAPASGPPQPAADARGTAPEPTYPRAPPAIGRGAQPALRPLPDLDESDAWFKLELAALFGAGSDERILANRLIERLVAAIDNLPRQLVAERIRPLAPLPEPFVAASRGDDGGYMLASDSYPRYDAVIELFTSTDPGAAAELYRRYYPLFQQAYVELGYPDGYFNDRLVEVIDHLLATPDVEDPVRLKRPNVLYEFADPELEALSAGQKLMIRMGPHNRARVKETLRAFRALIVDASAGGTR